MSYQREYVQHVKRKLEQTKGNLAYMQERAGKGILSLHDRRKAEARALKWWQLDMAWAIRAVERAEEQV